MQCTKLYSEVHSIKTGNLWLLLITVLLIPFIPMTASNNKSDIPPVVLWSDLDMLPSFLKM
jgi:hypothetical protein